MCSETLKVKEEHKKTGLKSDNPNIPPFPLPTYFTFKAWTFFILWTVLHAVKCNHFHRGFHIETLPNCNNKKN